jgi:hypothetical protein
LLLFIQLISRNSSLILIDWSRLINWLLICQVIKLWV